MKLFKLTMKNFRSFGPDAVTIDLENLTTFVGLNSSGKSTVMHAIRKMFSPIDVETKLGVSDFHINKTNVRSTVLEIEAYFEVQNKEEKHARFPFGIKNVLTDQESGKKYITVLLEASLNTDNNSVDQNLWVNRTGLYPHNYKPIQAIYIPAFRDPSEQLEIIKDSIFDRMLKFIQVIEGTNGEDINDLLSPEGFTELKEIISTQWKNFVFDKRYEKVKLELKENKFIITFHDEFDNNKYYLSQIGDGLKAVFYIVLVTSLLDLEMKKMDYFESPLRVTQTFEGDFEPYKQTEMYPVLSIILVEEPESHVSPHIVGRISERLEKNSENTNTQILVTSHSTSIIRRMSPEKIRYVSLKAEDYTTSVKKIKMPSAEDNAYKFISSTLHAYPELFFSRLVILGEGASENIVLSRVIETLSNVGLDNSAISFVSLGGRYVNHLWALLSEIDIPYITLLDLDRERGNDCGWGRIKHVIEQLKSQQEKEQPRYKLSELLTINETSYSEKNLKGMHNWEMNSIEHAEKLQEWAINLEKYDVFFSTPLDLDFMMYSAFEEAYKSTIPQGGGPNSQSTLEKSLKATLKDDNGDKGSTFTQNEKEKMIYYKYLFLGKRGKPTTHLLALQTLNNDQLKEGLPEVLGRFYKRIETKLIDDPFVGGRKKHLENN